MIMIGNKRQGARGVYVGRPSPLGNPFPMKSEADRAVVIRAYERWLREQLQDEGSAASRAIRALAERARKQDICLVYWCAPRPCHADVIKRVIEEIHASE